MHREVINTGRKPIKQRVLLELLPPTPVIHVHPTSVSLPILIICKARSYVR